MIFKAGNEISVALESAICRDLTERAGGVSKLDLGMLDASFGQLFNEAHPEILSDYSRSVAA